MDCQNSARTQEGETENSREVMQEQAVAAGDYRIASWAQRTASEDTRTARGPSQKTQTDLTGAASGTSSQVSGPTYHARLRFREPNLVPERIDAAQLPN